MGVDFKGCNQCGESRYDEYVGECQKCDNSLCTDCLINKEGVVGDTQFAFSYGIQFDIENLEEMKRLEEEEGYTFFKEDGTPYYMDGELIDDSSIQPIYCPFCSGNEIDDARVLEFLLGEYKRYYINVTKEDIWKEIKRIENDK